MAARPELSRPERTMGDPGRIRALDSVLSQRATAEPSILIGARDGPALSGCERASKNLVRVLVLMTNVHPGHEVGPTILTAVSCGRASAGVRVPVR